MRISSTTLATMIRRKTGLARCDLTRVKIPGLEHHRSERRRHFDARERRSTFQHFLTIIFGAPERVEIEANEQATYMYRKLMGSS